MMLELKSVRVFYGKVEVVREVSLSVEQGTMIGLIGSNGAGKTTIMWTVSGLKALVSGEIWFEDTRIDGKQPADIVKLGVAHVPEGRRLFPYMTVLENLMMGAYTVKDMKEIRMRMEMVYEHFPILKERSPQQAVSLSGGEQQMLALGRGLMSKPRLLLLDEPSLGLAPLMVQEVGRAIQSLEQRGLTILLTEQNARLAFNLCHRCYLIELGQVVAEGKGEELSKNKLVQEIYLGR